MTGHDLTQMIVSTPAISFPVSDPTPRMKESAASPTEDAQARQLSAALAKGNEAAFNQLYDRYHRRLFRLALALGHGDETLAYDAAQAALLTAAAKLKAVASEEHLWNWLARVARQYMSKHRRKQQRHPEPVSLEDLDCPVEGIVAETVLENGLDSALLALAPEDRQVVEWFYFDGLSHQEIAARLDATVKAVSSRLERARAKLRSSLLKERSRET
jgi:RNA polymerase sigma-70 factor, ECF subfamily